MTIPLSITLSEIKLSAFIILVFSKQKGLTLVFRNDPLESLKVSSTFDSIQFVREYLQRTIEQQLRNLMMDELPAIIHRLSLELWCPDAASKTTEAPREETNEPGVDPFASPPLDPVDINGNLLDAHAISELTLNGGGETQSLFSQRNLLRLAALGDSHRTLSLFTPGINEVVFRAWAGNGEHSESHAPAPGPPSLTKTQSYHGASSTTYTFSDSGSNTNGHLPSRPSAVSLHSFAPGTNHRSRPGRKKKHRVLNLRRTKSETGSSDVDGASEDMSETASSAAPLTESLLTESIPEEAELQLPGDDMGTVRIRPEKAAQSILPQKQAAADTPMAATEAKLAPLLTQVPMPRNSEKSAFPFPEVASPRPSVSSDTSSVILEHAWINKMAGEIARRVYDEKSSGRGPWDTANDLASMPPPDYEAAMRR